MRALVLGVLLLIVPALVALAALRSESPARAWPKTPAAPTAIPKPVWDGPATESLALLREITVKEAEFAAPALAACSRRLRRASEPGVTFRKCALRPLARMDGFASANSHMLSNLAALAPDECRQRVLELSGATAMLGNAARTTLQAALTLGREELGAASRTIRAFAREASKLARERGWKSECGPLPERDRTARDEAVA